MKLIYFCKSKSCTNESCWRNINYIDDDITISKDIIDISNQCEMYIKDENYKSTTQAK